MISAAIETGGGLWRYWLQRRWHDQKPVCAFVMLNPSTASAEKDDPTIRACMKWAQVLGCGSLEVVNLFAFRSPHPRDLEKLRDEDAIGRHNDEHIVATCARASVVIVAWGAHPLAYDRGANVKRMLEDRGHELMCLGLSADGAPKHPLARGKHRVEIKPQNVQRYR